MISKHFLILNGATKVCSRFLTAFAILCLACEFIGHASMTAYNAQAAAQSEFKFQMVKAASGVTENGGRFSVNVYRASDGSIISLRVDRFASAALARKELTNVMRHAIALGAGANPYKPSGRRRDRVVTALPPEDGEIYNAVLWTHKRELYRIEGLSLEHVLEFERQHYR